MLNIYELAYEVVEMCKYFGILEIDEDDSSTVEEVLNNLYNIAFVESIIDIFYERIQLKQFNNTENRERLRMILIQLEIVKRSLELKELECSKTM